MSEKQTAAEFFENSGKNPPLSHKKLALPKVPYIKDVGIFQGGRGVSNSDVARY